MRSVRGQEMSKDRNYCAPNCPCEERQWPELSKCYVRYNVLLPSLLTPATSDHQSILSGNCVCRPGPGGSLDAMQSFGHFSVLLSVSRKSNRNSDFTESCDRRVFCFSGTVTWCRLLNGVYFTNVLSVINTGTVRFGSMLPSSPPPFRMFMEVDSKNLCSGENVCQCLLLCYKSYEAVVVYDGMTRIMNGSVRKMLRQGTPPLGYLTDYYIFY